MDPCVSFITFGVGDIAAARRFYVEGLGWQPTFEVPDEVCFIQVAPGVLLSLWRREALANDMQAELGTGRSAASVAHNVASDDEVVRVIEDARAAGAKILKEPALYFFGGWQGYFEDPCGFVWEVAHNPGWSVDADGTVYLGPAPS